MATRHDPSLLFTQEEGWLQLGGIQALVRLPLDQIRADRRRGLKPAMFISGYRGSPVGGLDQAYLAQNKLLKEHEIVFNNGMNEDLAATAVWGTQMLHAVGKQNFDAVLGTWYGKAPGVDRSGDALKHGNYTGIQKNGGVLAIFGDDPSCKSSSLTSQSEPGLYHWGIPSIYPGNQQDILDFGLHGYMLSRVSGCWIGLKIVTNVADGTGSAEVSPDRIKPIIPVVELDGRPFVPHMNLGMNVRADALEMEYTLYNARHEMARRYARANNLNREVIANPSAWLGIITAGKTYHDVRQAFMEMGLPTEDDIRRAGIRLLKMGMLFPMEPTVLRDFAQGLEEIFVIEEKRPFLEMFAKENLYGRANAPRIVGKFDHEEKALLPMHGELEPDIIGRALMRRLGQKTRLESAEAWIKRLDEIHSRSKVVTLARPAWYCSGCPHNSSTKALPGSIVSAGIGCHTMAMWMNRNVVMGTHMGAEGAQWIGMAPFTDVPHIFQNMGDGTFFHSGLLALNYTAASQVNITYKILYNSHTSMTGGQEYMGGRPVTDLVNGLLAYGASRVIVTTEDLNRYNNVALPAKSEVWHRDRLQEAQDALAKSQGTTVLIHDQECAAELRRMRGKGQRPEPEARVIVNERVCEGCGDCGVKSNCISVEAVETEFGDKTRIHQPSCNKDYSCVKGFCPSFLTVTPKAAPAPAPGPDGKPTKAPKKARRMPALDREIPEPTFKVNPDNFGVHIMGIGGTGSVTVATTIANAAKLDGKFTVGLDQTGLAQKGGTVISDIKVSKERSVGSNKITDGSTDLYLGFDILNATDYKNFDKCHPDRTIAVVSTGKTQTGPMAADRKVKFPEIAPLTRAIDAVTRKADNVYVDAQAMAEGLFADNMATNMFMVGCAYQAGALPIHGSAIENAVRQGGVGVDMGLLAFKWGRMAAIDPDFVRAEVKKYEAAEAVPELTPEARAIVDAVGASGETKRLLEIRVPDLIDYQDAAYARRYADVVKKAVQAEQKAAPASTAYAEAVARFLYKLMAYKDEYEVARLHADPKFLAKLDAQFKDGYTVQYHLAPPTISKRDPLTGELIKRPFGPHMLTAFRWLAKFKGLRGGALDFFGKTEERRHERKLIEDYIAQVGEVAGSLSAGNHAVAVQLARVPDLIRGYGHVKERNMKVAKDEEARLLAQWRAPSPTPQVRVAA
jgi:indolepyruvate ferredoxin oxidoreductase